MSAEERGDPSNSKFGQILSPENDFMMEMSEIGQHITPIRKRTFKVQFLLASPEALNNARVC